MPEKATYLILFIQNAQKPNACALYAYQAPPSIGFFRKEYWSGLPFPSPGDLPDPGIKAMPLNVSCIGRWVLYHQCHLRSLPGLRM